MMLAMLRAFKKEAIFSVIMHDLPEAYAGEIGVGAALAKMPAKEKSRFSYEKGKFEAIVFPTVVKQTLKVCKEQYGLNGNDCDEFQKQMLQRYHAVESDETFLSRLVKSVEKMQSSSDYVRWGGKFKAIPLPDTPEAYKDFCLSYILKPLFGASLPPTPYHLRHGNKEQSPSLEKERLKLAATKLRNETLRNLKPDFDASLRALANQVEDISLQGKIKKSLFERITTLVENEFGCFFKEFAYRIGQDPKAAEIAVRRLINGARLTKPKLCTLPINYKVELKKAIIDIVKQKHPDISPAEVEEYARCSIKLLTLNQVDVQTTMLKDRPFVKKFELNKIINSDRGKGLIVYEAGQNNSKILISTPEQDKNAKIIDLWGFDFNGRAYTSKMTSYTQLLIPEGLNAEKRITYHYNEFAFDQSNKVDNVLTFASRMSAMKNSYYLDDAFSKDAEIIVKKFYLPRYLDKKGRVKEDILDGPNVGLTLMTHSFGGWLAIDIEGVWMKLIPEFFAKKGIPKGVFPNTDEGLAKLASKNSIIARGTNLPLVGYNQKRLFNTFNILALTDRTLPMFSYHEALYRILSNSPDEVVLVADAKAKNRVQIILKDSVPSLDGKGLNFSGHAAPMLENSIPKTYRDILKQVVKGDTTAIRKLQEQAEPISPEGIIEKARGIGFEKTLANWITQMIKETEDWKLKKGLNKHPFLCQILESQMPADWEKRLLQMIQESREKL